jgi:hypothetical protein
LGQLKTGKRAFSFHEKAAALDPLPPARLTPAMAAMSRRRPFGSAGWLSADGHEETAGNAAKIAGKLPLVFCNWHEPARP